MSDETPPAVVRVPVAGAETAPSGYVDYFDWGFHPHADGDMQTHRISLILGRHATLPRELVWVREGIEAEPAKIDHEIRVSFVAEMSPNTLRNLRDAIDRTLDHIRPSDSEPDDPAKNESVLH